MTQPLPHDLHPGDVIVHDALTRTIWRVDPTRDGFRLYFTDDSTADLDPATPVTRLHPLK